ACRGGPARGTARARVAVGGVPRRIPPPLHEFLPNYEELVAETTELRVSGRDPSKLAELDQVKARVEQLREANPMLGLRGVRLSILYPEITRMQVRALMKAAIELKRAGLVAGSA